jgi:hypothetical protein
MHPKLEPRLERELEVVEAAGQSEHVIPVLIEHAAPAVVVRGQDRRAALEAVERRSRELQQGIVARLRALNGQGIQQLGLANAISASLMPSQIRTIADHPDVKIVRLARPEQVTA